MQYDQKSLTSNVIYELISFLSAVLSLKKETGIFCLSKKGKERREGHSCKLDSNKAVWHTSLGIEYNGSSSAIL